MNISSRISNPYSCVPGYSLRLMDYLSSISIPCTPIKASVLGMLIVSKSNSCMVWRTTRKLSKNPLTATRSKRLVAAVYSTTRLVGMLSGAEDTSVSAAAAAAAATTPATATPATASPSSLCSSLFLTGDVSATVTATSSKLAFVLSVEVLLDDNIEMEIERRTCADSSLSTVSARWAVDARRWVGNGMAMALFCKMSITETGLVGVWTGRSLVQVKLTLRMGMRPLLFDVCREAHDVVENDTFTCKRSRGKQHCDCTASTILGFMPWESVNSFDKDLVGGFEISHSGSSRPCIPLRHSPTIQAATERLQSQP